jgi:hypothetical protein
MAVIKDRQLVYTEELNKLQNEKTKLLESIKQTLGTYNNKNKLIKKNKMSE